MPAAGKADDRPGPRPAAVKGTAAKGELKAGMTYRFLGRRVTHPQYGIQFEFQSFTPDRPHDQGGVVLYLSKEADGIGAVTAGRLWDAFGPAAIDVVMNEPERAVAAGVLSARVAGRASASLKDKATLYRTRVDLMGLFGKLGFPGALAQAAIERWGVAAAETIRADPFEMVLARLPGCGFLRADQLHHALGLPADSPRRQMMCAWHKLASSTGDGHTWHHEQEIMERVAADIGAGADPGRAVEMAVAAGLLARQRSSDKKSWVALASRADSEIAAARRLAEMLQAAPDSWPDPAAMTELSDHQRDRLALALAGRIGILCGTPGTGKTHAAAAVIRHAERRVGPAEIAVVAPTGKAAVRITQALAEHGLRREAQTVHRLLGVAGRDREGNFTFRHGEETPLPYRLVICDEFSMVDTDLLACLLRACGPATHVLFVGDPYQLPPVGHGAPLRDMLFAGVPHGELTEVRRNSGLIVRACASIKDGYRYETADTLDDTNNLRTFEAADHAAIQAGLRGLCRRLAERRAADPTAPDPVNDFQVLCVINEGNPAARVELNELLQEELNPLAAGQSPPFAHPFRVGDKVICLKNGSQTAVVCTPGNDHSGVLDSWYPPSPPADRQHYIANGDMGRVLAAGPAALVVRFACPPRTVRVHLHQPSPRRAAAEVDGPQWGAVDLGYAITTHRSQGSDWPVVAIVIDDSDRAARVASREFLYTAISRAKRRCLLLGRRAVADQWCQTVVMKRRMTFLAQRLQVALRKSAAPAAAEAAPPETATQEAPTPETAVTP